jgi:hypothetical protein
MDAHNELTSQNEAMAAHRLNTESVIGYHNRNDAYETYCAIFQAVDNLSILFWK